MLETIMWDGRITNIQADHREKRLELFGSAKSGQWDEVLAFLSLPNNAEFLNVLEPDAPAFNTLLHDAALTNADPAVVHQLVNMGAWRTRRNANHQTALDLAIQQGHTPLYNILEPVLKMTVPPETLQRLEQHFHDLIRNHRDSGPIVAGQALQLPQLAPCLEMGGNPMFFLIPGMFGGIDYRLENGSSETVLYTHISSRMDEPSDGQIHKITLSGIELLAEGREIDFSLLLEIIHGGKRIIRMKAAVLQAHGGLEQVQYVENLPNFEPGAGEVRLNMKAAALNRVDLFVRAGWKGLNLHFPHVIGSDGAGVIDAVGIGIKHLAVGDPVAVDPMFLPDDPTLFMAEYENQSRIAIAGEHRSGFAAEYVVVPARNVVKMPADFSFQEAAAAGLVYVTAWHSMITRGQLKAGETVLIVGAGGGVNSASLQIAKLAGAKVIVVGSNADKCEQARQLGADVTINREQTPDWAKEVFSITEKRGVDVVVDNVGAATLNHSMRACRIGGRILIVGGTTGYDAQINVAQIFARQISLIGSTMGTHADYATVMNLVFQGKLKAVIGQVFPLDQAREAQAALEKGDQFGKIVIDI